MRIFLAFSVFFLSLHIIFAQPLQLDWVAEYPCYGPSALEFDKVLVDEAQNVYLFGAAPSDNNSFQYESAILTQRYDSTGQLVWEAKFDGMFRDKLFDASFDGIGGVLAAGIRYSLPQGPPGRAEVVSYDMETGEEKWHNFISDTILQGGSLFDIDLGSDGAIYAFGAISEPVWEFDSNKIFVAKLLPTAGEVVWKKILPNTFSATRGKALPNKIRIYGGRVLDSIGYSSTIIDVDHDGNIIQIVDIPDLTFGIGFFNAYFFFEDEGHLIMFGNKIYKVGWSSTAVWEFDFARGLPNMIGKAMAATHDEQGNIYATGYMRDTTTQDEFTQTIKLSPAGELLWATLDAYDQAATRFEQGTTMAVSDHHVFVCSSLWYYDSDGNVTGIDYRPILYDNNDGSILYDTLIDGNEFDVTYYSNYAKSHFYLLGRSYLSGGTDDDYRYKLFKFGVEEPSAVGDVPYGAGDLEVYPNPFGASTTIELKGIETNMAMNLKLLDVTGRVVQQRAFRSPSLTLQREQLPSGLYFIKVETEDGRPIAGGRVVAK